MKTLKHILWTTITLGAIAYAVFFAYNYIYPCSQPTRYSIGRYDTSFGLDKEIFLKYTKEAANIWNQALGREQFVYDPEAKFLINLIFDERQAETVAKQRTESGLAYAEEFFKQIDRQFEAAQANYKKMEELYLARVAAFEEREVAYREAVEKWNAGPKKSKQEYEKLAAEEAYLKNEFAAIKEQEKLMNERVSALNVVLEKRNNAAKEYNDVAKQYNKSYGHGVEFNQAEYRVAGRQKEINIYQFGTKNDLVLALAHEFGHALGMDHVENPDSILYYITREEMVGLPAPTAEDLAELGRVCRK